MGLAMAIFATMWYIGHPPIQCFVDWVGGCVVLNWPSRAVDTEDNLIDLDDVVFGDFAF